MPNWQMFTQLNRIYHAVSAEDPSIEGNTHRSYECYNNHTNIFFTSSLLRIYIVALASLKFYYKARYIWFYRFKFRERSLQTDRIYYKSVISDNDYIGKCDRSLYISVNKRLFGNCFFCDFLLNASKGQTQKYLRTINQCALSGLFLEVSNHTRFHEFRLTKEDLNMTFR